jgi:hypothetical protein
LRCVHRSPWAALGALTLLVALTACSSGGSQSAIPNSTLPDTATTAVQPNSPTQSSTGTGQSNATTEALSGVSSTTTAGVPSHIPTWAYDEYWGQGADATGSEVRSLITYAEGGYGNGKALSDCATSPKYCYSVFYFASNQLTDSAVCPDSQTTDFFASSAESWFVHMSGHTDYDHRVRAEREVSCSRGSQRAPVYAPNTANAGVKSWFENYLRNNANGYDYYFMDLTAGTVVDQFYGPSGGMCDGLCYSTEEQPSNAYVVSAHGSFAGSMYHKDGAAMMFFYNGLSFDGAQIPNDSNVLASSDHFTGAVCENCVVDNGVFHPSMYAPILNAMALINETSRGKFVELNNGYSAAGSGEQIAQRLVTTAVAWLGFKGGQTVVWANLEDNTRGLAVWPEDLIYPSDPLETMARSNVTIEVAPGVWRREFGSCYYKGGAFGRCAAILNANSGARAIEASWLKESYGHVISLSGGDVLSGGALHSTAAFKTGSTYVPAYGAILLKE